MPIEPKRIEAAAKVMAALDGVMWDSIPDRSQSVGLPYGRELYRTRAAMLLERAFPELASDPPTAWVAPIKSTLAVDGAIWMALNAEGADPMQAARDAYTKEQT